MTHELSRRAKQFIRGEGKRVVEMDPRIPPFVGVTPKVNPLAVFGPGVKLPDDYESCGYCGFDHSYEYAAAEAWHKANPCSYCDS